jgi:hypothetical protein
MTLTEITNQQGNKVENNTVKQGDMIAVWFSCGAASAVAAKETLERYGSIADVRIVNNPIAEEDADNARFLKDVEAWLGVKVETATNSKFPSSACVDVWEKRRFMSGPRGAPCTLELKKEARRQWEVTHKPDWHVLGFTADEKRRSDRFIEGERANLLPVLIDAGITKANCFQILRDADLALPSIYSMGYPNANCVGCVKATSPAYWNHVRKMHPSVFDERARQSRDIGAKLVRVKGKRIFLDELDPLAKGQAIKNMDFECGIFCEERK